MSELPIDIKTEDVSLLELPSSAEDIHVKTQKASQNTDLDMWEILRISKAGWGWSNTSKLIDIDRHIKEETKKLTEVEDFSAYSASQIKDFKNSLENMRIEHQTMLEMLSQNRKDLELQVAKIKQTIENVLDEEKSFAARVRTLFHENGITIISIFTSSCMTISTIVLAITGVFQKRDNPVASRAFLPKDQGELKKRLKKLAGI